MPPSLKTISLLLITTLMMSSFTAPKVNGRVKTVETVLSASDEVVTVRYDYDTAGRLSSISNQQNHTHDCTIRYDHDTIEYLYASQKEKRHRKLLRSAQGSVISENGGHNYTYDSAGYLTGIIRDSSDMRTWTIAGGDIVSSYYRDGPRYGAGRSTYLAMPEYRSYGISWMGRSSAHLVDTDVYKGDAGTFTTHHRYTFDTEGRVRTETTVTSSPHTPDVVSMMMYTYTD